MPPELHKILIIVFAIVGYYWLFIKRKELFMKYVEYTMWEVPFFIVAAYVYFMLAFMALWGVFNFPL